MESDWRDPGLYASMTKSAASVLLYSTLMILLLSSASISADWNQWHGPNRDGAISESSGWPEGWPPEELWRMNVGLGASSPIIVKDRVYVMGWKDNNDHVYCLDAHGKDGKPNVVWTKS